MKAQLKYADKRDAAIAVIEGSDERARGEVTVKDLALGAELAKSTEVRAAWVKDRPAQTSVKREQLVADTARDAWRAGRLSVMGGFPQLRRGAARAARCAGGADPRASSPRRAMRASSRRSCSRPKCSSTARARRSAAAPSCSTDPEGVELCLRPDLTIPVCRMHLETSGDKFPARYAYHGPAFRFQPGEPDRPSQFLQTGVECLGVAEPQARRDRSAGARGRRRARHRAQDRSRSRSAISTLFSGLIDALDIPAQWRGRLKRHFWRPSYFRELLERLSNGAPVPGERYLAIARQRERGRGAHRAAGPDGLSRQRRRSAGARARRSSTA